MIFIRPITGVDYPLVLSWWPEGQPKPVPTMMPPTSTFIATIGGIPAVSMSVYLTNTPDVAFLECFAGNPVFRGKQRHAASKALMAHIEHWTKTQGYRTLIGFTDNTKLNRRYQDLGYTPSLANITMYSKEL